MHNRTNIRSLIARQRLPELLTLVNLMALFLIWIAETFVAEKSVATMLLTYGPQQGFLIPSVALAGWALMRRRRRVLMANGAAIVLVTMSLLGMSMPLRIPGTPHGTQVRVMTYNIHHPSDSLPRIVEAIRRADPDIVCMQETDDESHHSIPAGKLARLLPEWHAVQHWELQVLSKHPITRMRSYTPAVGPGTIVMETSISISGSPVTVLNVHLANVGTPDVLKEKPSRVVPSIEKTIKVRGAQLSDLLEAAYVAMPSPVIIAGDFNTPPRGDVYRLLSSRYKDAFGTASWGFGWTYPAAHPLMRIDYIFAGDGVSVQRCWVPDASGSDHKPVVADLVVR